MPIDDLAGEVIGDLLGRFAGLAVETVAEHIFSSNTARFFHGVGRRLIATATFGRKRIPSSLRVIPKGSSPKPRTSDWLALWVGIVAWVGAGGVVAYLLFF
jgi:hypothetical protein